MKKILFILILLVLTSCRKSEAPTVESSAAPIPQISFISHHVTHPGETLTAIALWYTGSVENWKAIKQSNPQMSASSMRIGDVILIPEPLLKRRTPLPLAFLDSVRRAESKPQQPAITEAAFPHSGTENQLPIAESPQHIPASEVAIPNDAAPVKPAREFFLNNDTQSPSAGTRNSHDTIEKEKKKKELLENLLQ